METKEIFLIVEDDLKQLARYKELVEKLGYIVFAVDNKIEAIKILDHKSVSVLLSDIHLSANANLLDGLEIIEYAKNNSPEVIALAMSNDPDIATYHKALNMGAAHFVKKPIVREDEIAFGIEVAKNKLLLSKVSNVLFANYNLPQEILRKCPDGMVLNESLRNQAAKIAAAKKLPTIISGETGTGKEEFAKLIFRERCKRDGTVPFVSVNCGNIDDNMAASLLFGHIKGSFTGAISTTNGYIGEADGGILFLDEIHCLSKTMQQRLLRVLNDGTYQRLGDSKELISRFQLICASTKNLDEEVGKGTFLLDLQMRITGPDIVMLPLRERLEDIPLLVALFFAKEGVRASEEEYEKIVKKCQGYYWQGNIRQLHLAIQTLIGMSEFSGSLSADDLPQWGSMLPPGKKSSEQTTSFAPSTSSVIQELINSIETDGDLNARVNNYEKILIHNALSRSEIVQKAAASLNIPRSTLEFKRKKHGLS